ncbi:YSIRK-type signal peptide-containing protein, partial [Streptococcus sp. 1449]|uniref:YSIRK-type signal peptide-containing protein n=1 Tax=Streptococcus sp. 1449 TaxID=2582658 RepID=UPI0015656A3F
MRKSNREVNGEKVFRYSIRKYHFGAASVAVAALMFFANGAVKADALAVSPVTANTEKVNAGVTDLTEGVPIEKSLEDEGNKEIVAPEPAEKISNKEDGAGSNTQGEKEIKVSDKAVLTTNQIEEINKAETNGKEEEAVANKDKLESLLKEIDQLNLKDYTEDTVKVLQEKVAKAKEVLVNAKTQKEIAIAYNALVGYKNAGLKRVPKPKGELTPKPDTTNGKETVGKKAENTDPNGTNIAGHNHSLNGTSLPEGSGLRTAPKPELADVQIGRWNGTRRTFDRSNVFVTPANQGIVGNVMKIKAISASDNFTNIEVTGNQGFPLQVKKNINGKEAELYFEGNTPSNGSWNMTVTATTAKGTKSFNFGYYTALRKPTILTQNTALEGKAKEKPTIEVEVPTFSPAPTGSKFKVYLVRGGSTNGWDNNGNAYPSGYSVLASADVVASAGGKGTATINASNYRVSELGTTAFKAITVIEVNGRENDTDPGERGSWFSDERRATEKLANKTALT